MRVPAPAKINLALDVLGKRPDGYHELRMIMQTVSLYDELELERTAEEGIRLEIVKADANIGAADGGNAQIGEDAGDIAAVQVPDSTGPVDGQGQTAGDIPADARNLAWRAADLLLREFQPGGGLLIRLAKRIPSSAGLAGGSSDAAAVLRGVNALFGLGLDGEALRARGVKLGADVPYCLLGGTALAEGIGEILTPLPALPACRILLVKPPEGVSTKEIFEAVDSRPVTSHPDVDGMAAAVRAGDLSGITSRVGNVLADVTKARLAVIGELEDELRAAGASCALMSGSGPTVFGIFRNEETAGAAAEKIRAMHADCGIFLTEPAELPGL